MKAFIVAGYEQWYKEMTGYGPLFFRDGADVVIDYSQEIDEDLTITDTTGQFSTRIPVWFVQLDNRHDLPE